MSPQRGATKAQSEDINMTNHSQTITPPSSPNTIPTGSGRSTSTPRTPLPEANRSESKILSLPLEIRQHILSYVFCEAVEQDIAFNANLQKKLTRLPAHAVSAPKYLTPERLPEHMRTTKIEDGYTINRNAWCQRSLGCTGCRFCRRPVHFHERPPCVPRIHAMANKLSAVNSQLKEEVKFVFKQCLDQFRSEEEQIKIQEAGPDDKEVHFD
ncbi:hypothetical protein Vi05172_g1501 [Venturia inaequalis]|uniref:Uncharacterized protein n=1 Tax=Venturia inaequalis TaxID=5025 RepID=A0A8H3VMX1_VENIN|nr:hypothetical protein EG327_009892 [Venturia inaequalis]RDI88867.1 hypothetical protein Vi05172_g1501 [Venturia inaequalis]